MGDTGFETSECHGGNDTLTKTNVKSNVKTTDSDLKTVVELWKHLDQAGRQKVLSLAKQLAR